MKIIVFSDSHGYTKNMLKALDMFKDEISLIVHLGDCVDDVKDISKISNIAIKNVSGNNDFSNTPYEQCFNIDDNKIFITHGHEYNVYFDVNRLYFRLRELGANIGLFGHTHNPFVLKEDDIFILNPGSISFPRKLDFPTFAIIDLNEDITYDFYGIIDDEIKKID